MGSNDERAGDEAAITAAAADEVLDCGAWSSGDCLAISSATMTFSLQATKDLIIETLQKFPETEKKKSLTKKMTTDKLVCSLVCERTWIQVLTF